MYSYLKIGQRLSFLLFGYSLLPTMPLPLHRSPLLTNHYPIRAIMPRVHGSQVLYNAMLNRIVLVFYFTCTPHATVSLWSVSVRARYTCKRTKIYCVCEYAFYFHMWIVYCFCSAVIYYIFCTAQSDIWSAERQQDTILCKCLANTILCIYSSLKGLPYAFAIFAFHLIPFYLKKNNMYLRL